MERQDGIARQRGEFGMGRASRIEPDQLRDLRGGGERPIRGQAEQFRLDGETLLMGCRRREAAEIARRRRRDDKAEFFVQLAYQRRQRRLVGP